MPMLRGARDLAAATAVPEPFTLPQSPLSIYSITMPRIAISCIAVSAVGQLTSRSHFIWQHCNLSLSIP